MTNTQNITTLENGLRIITDRIDSVGSVAIGVWYDVGARDELPHENGIAHMVEHMMFKGTPSRNAQQIAEQIENVGGHVNAYTSREMTAYYIHLLKDDTPLAIDILSDILQHSHFDEGELERERQVILQEIGMVQDTPDDIVFDNFQETAFPGQSVGAPILGRPDVISSIKSPALHDYVRARYMPQRTVISAAGNLNHDDIVAQVKDRFSAFPANQNMARPQSTYQGGYQKIEKDLEQSHIVLGFQGVSHQDDARITANLYSTILGGGMSSRLFQEIREKRGLVYSIYSFHMGLIDNGLLGIYAGTGPDSLKDLIPVTCDELKKMTDTISADELNRAKAQMRADLVMNQEKMMSRATRQAKQLIMYGKTTSVNEAIAKINAVQISDIQSFGARILQSPPTITAIGPLNHLPTQSTILNTLAG